CTSARMVQPTEQCVQTDFRISTLPPPASAVWASAFCTRVATSEEAAAKPPMVSPELRRNARRSTVPWDLTWSADESRARPAAPFAFFLNMLFSFDYLRPAQLPLRNVTANGSEPGELVVPLHVLRLAVKPLTRLAVRRCRRAAG